MIYPASLSIPSNRRRVPVIQALVAVLVAVFLGACSPAPSWKLKNISHLVHSLQFRLTNDHGKQVDESDYRGDIVMLYFGYTHCPDTCPLTLAKLGRAVRALKPAVARRVKILFVTVDPKRDTLAQLADYTSAFGPEFTGLRGTPSRLHTVAERYRVTYSYGKPDANGNYAVTHSSGVFIFDGRGKARLLATFNTKAPAITHDLRLLASENA